MFTLYLVVPSKKFLFYYLDKTFHFSKQSIHVNEEQATAIQRPANVHQRILAAAGSGKTTTLSARIAYLIEEYKVPSQSIVLMTFSRNAAHQMKARIESLIGPSQIWAGTFHGLSRGLLKKFAPEKLKTLFFIDELVSMGEEWLHTEKGRKWVGTIKYVFVDEFQDINENQWRMLQRMLHPGARLIVVGDDCQNIYTWRGSHVKYILELEKQVRGLVDDQLRRNYRSRETIIRAANAVMAKIPTLEWKGSMIAEKKGGEKPHVRFFYRMQDESKWILQTIQDILEDTSIVKKPTIAVLSRTNNDLYRVEEELIMAGLQCRLRDLGIDEQSGKGQGATIDLVTLHASKGLEWDIVFIINCNDDVFPSSKKPDAIICERRLFYVGVTRARDILHISYTRDERSLCRFVREIPNQLMTYHGLARYILSDIEIQEGKKKLRDVLSCLDGDDLHSLREEGVLSWLSRENLKCAQIFKPGEVWGWPTWAVGEHLGDFQRFLRIWVLRHIAFTTNRPFRETIVEQMLFTLRIFAEDREFWLEWSVPLRECIEEFLGGEENAKAPPSVDYPMMEAWSRKKGLSWQPKDLIRATSIVGKIRGQLRPIRFDTYDLQEFRIAPTRYVVPTEWRADVLRSWRRVVNPALSWKECLVDMWKLGAMALVTEGRNAALYRAQGMSGKLAEDTLHEYLECLEQRLSEHYVSEKLSNASKVLGLSEQFHYEDLFRECVDIHSEKCILKIGTSGAVETQDLLYLAMIAWFAQKEGIQTTSVGIFLPLEGRFYTIELPSGWNEKAERVLQRALV